MFHPVGTTEAERRAFEQARVRLDDDRLRVAPIKLYIDDVIEPRTAPWSSRTRTARACAATRSGRRRSSASLSPIWSGGGSRPHPRHGRIVASAPRSTPSRRAATRERAGDRRHLDGAHRMSHRPGAAALRRARRRRVHAAASLRARDRGGLAHERGPERWRYAWAFRSLRDAGATLALSSDWNVAQMDPLVGIYSAFSPARTSTVRRRGVPQETVDPRPPFAPTPWAARSPASRRTTGAPSNREVRDLVMLSDDLFAFAADDPAKPTPDTRVEPHDDRRRHGLPGRVAERTGGAQPPGPRPAPQLRSRGPTYSLAGRITLLSAYCSRTCAVQPAIRARAKMGAIDPWIPRHVVHARGVQVDVGPQPFCS